MKKRKNKIEKQPPLPAKKPSTYWGSAYGVSDGENPQQVRERKELGEDNLEMEPKFRKKK